jgi:hypothetical protein
MKGTSRTCIAKTTVKATRGDEEMTTEQAIWTILGHSGSTEDYNTARSMGYAPVPFYQVKEAGKYLTDNYSDILPPLANRRQVALAVLRWVNNPKHQFTERRGDAEMNQAAQELKRNLELLLDHHGMHDLLGTLCAICDDKAEHLGTNRQDRATAREWIHAATQIERALRDIDV